MLAGKRPSMVSAFCRPFNSFIREEAILRSVPSFSSDSVAASSRPRLVRSQSRYLSSPRPTAVVQPLEAVGRRARTATRGVADRKGGGGGGDCPVRIASSAAGGRVYNRAVLHDEAQRG